MTKNQIHRWKIQFLMQSFKIFYFDSIKLTEKSISVMVHQYFHSISS